MKPWGRFIFVFIAYGLALLHTAVPHHHADGSSSDMMFSHAGCQYSHTSGGLLQRALSTDLGLGHLETFKKNTDTQLETSARVVVAITFFLPIANAPAISPVAESVGGYVEKLKRQLLLFSVSHFRAPPALG